MDKRGQQRSGSGANPLQALFRSAVRSHQAMDLVQAETGYRRVLAADPDHVDSLRLLGVLAAQRGQPEEAVTLMRRAVEVQPGYAEAWAGLGLALHALGRDEEALAACGQAVALRPAHAESHNNLGAALRALGRDEEAMAAFRQALALRPAYAEAHKNLGAALRAVGRGEESLAALRQAVALKPDFAAAWIDLAAALHALGRYVEALNACDRALALQPSSAEAHGNRGNALRELGRLDEAIAAYRRAIELKPADVDAWVNLAVALQEMGRTNEARDAAQRALAVDPTSAHAWYVASELKTFAPGDADIERMEGLLASADEDDRIDLEFALGKAWMDAGDPDRAFARLDEGNRRVRAGFRYSVEADLDRFLAIARALSPDWMERFASAGDASDLQVFVVGMVRSGTTLVEQVLASHPQVHGAGEVTVLADAAQVLGPERAALGYPGFAPTLTAEDLAAMGRAYVDHLAALAPGKRRVVDKLPANFQFAGLIHRALPNARIIHCRRDPIDTCLSIYSKRFVGRQDYAYDLRELGLYYRGYERLMEHWRGLLPPDRFIEVDYEAVVGDLETQARRLTAFCGLDWDPACLDFHTTRRPVRTASANQVRQALYRTSVGRWKPYERHLGPLLAALE